MNKKLLLSILLLVPTTHFAQQRVRPARAQAAAVESEFELLYARPFILQEAYEHSWRKETPMVSSGYVLVLRADAERIRPRQVYEPVLFVGGQTAERVNAPQSETAETAQLVVVVPAPLDEEGKVDLDPWKVPIFLGSKVLPEDVDEKRIQLELTQAKRLGVPGPKVPKVSGLAAVTQPKQVLRLADRNALQLELASLIEFYSPEEIDLVNGMRVPVTK